MQEKGKRRLLILSTVVVLAVSGLWMFRQRPFLSSVGKATAVWKWGMCREVRVDGDGDGRVDLRGLFSWSWRTPDAGTPFVELWESLGCDGIYDVWVEYGEDGRLAVLNVDTDRDGGFDLVLEGTAGQQHLEELRTESACLSWSGSS